MPLRWCNCWRSPVLEAAKLLVDTEVSALSFETGEHHGSVPGRTHVSSLPLDDDHEGDSKSSSSNEGDDDGDDEEEEENQEWGQQPKTHNSAFDQQLKQSITLATDEIRRLNSGDSTRSDMSHDSYASFHRANKSDSMMAARRSGSQRLFDEDDDEDDGSRRWPRRVTTAGSDEDDDTSFRDNDASFMQSRRVLDDNKP